jgi:hypothetical protein
MYRSGGQRLWRPFGWCSLIQLCDVAVALSCSRESDAEFLRGQQDRVDDRESLPNRWPNHLDLARSAEQLVEEDGDLELGEVGAQAVVGAATAEGHKVVW